MNKLEQIRKLRALEQGSPYEQERAVAKRKANALEEGIHYEDWMLELGEVFHRHMDEKYAEELLNILIEKYYDDGCVGNILYIEHMKEGACMKFDGDYYWAKVKPESISNLEDAYDENDNLILTKDEELSLNALRKASDIVSDYLKENNIVLF